MDFVKDFGAVGDGAADNSAALNAFNAAAVAASRPNVGVRLDITPGLYNFDHSKCLNFLNNIPLLRMVGYGATFQNTYQGSNSAASRSWGLPYPGVSATQSWLINTTNVGDTSLATTTPGDTINVAPGEMLMVAAEDIQGYGYPINVNRFEFVRIVSTDPVTGQLLLVAPLRNAYRSDFSDLGAAVPCGRARIWKLSYGGKLWDYDHTFEGMSILQAPNGTTYQTSCGRSITYLNCPKLVGPSPSVIQKLRYENIGQFLTNGEPDKCGDNMEFINCDTQFGLQWQSGSINRVYIKGGSFGNYNTGCANSTIIEDADITSLSHGSTYGTARNVTIRGGIVRGVFNSFSTDLFMGTTLMVTGTDVTYAGGTFTIARTSSQAPHWCLPMGALINLAATGGQFSGNVGTGIVRQVRGDATNIYVDTTLQFTSLPSWAGATPLVRMKRCGEIVYDNVAGCDDARHASWAHRQGLRPWEVLRAVFDTQSAPHGNFTTTKWGGQLTELDVNVTRAASAPAAFGFTSYMVANSDFTTQVLLTHLVDVTKCGKRTISLVGSNLQATDSLSFGAAAATQLPAPQSVRSLGWSLPVGCGARVELVAKFDVGIYGDPPGIQFDVTGNTLLGIGGQML